MPLHLADTPNNLLDILRRDLKARADREGFLLPALRRVAPSGLAVSIWHRMYEIDRDALSPSEPLREVAHFDGWRSLLHGAGGTPIALATQSAPDGDASTRFVLSEGEDVQNFLSAVALSERALADEKTALELAVIEIQALYLTALWLRAPSPAEDRLMVYGVGHALDGLTQFSFCDAPAFVASIGRMLARLPDEEFV